MGEDALQILRGILEFSKLPITIADLDGHFVLFSRAAEELTGYSSEEMLGQHASILFPRKWRIPVVFSHVLEKGVVEDVEGIVRCKDGRELPVSIYMTMVHDVLGRPSGFLAITKDLSEQRRLETDLERARSKEEFFTDLICHDVRNYDQTLLGYMDLMLEGAVGELDESAWSLVEQARHDAYELRDFIERIRFLTGREPGADLLAGRVNVGQMLMEFAEGFSLQEGEDREFVVLDSSSRDCWVMADPLLGRLFWDFVLSMLGLKGDKSCGPCRATIECVEEVGRVVLQFGGCVLPESVGDVSAAQVLDDSSETFVLRSFAQQFGGRLLIEETAGGHGVRAMLELKLWDQREGGTEAGQGAGQGEKSGSHGRETNEVFEPNDREKDEP